MQIETVWHIQMYECNKIHNVWKLLQRWLTYVLNKRVDITPESILCNNYIGLAKHGKHCNTNM